MNNVNLIGRISSELELKTTPNNKSVANFSVAVQSFKKDNDGKFISDFFNVVCWEKVAEFVTKHCNKGMRIGLSGSLQQRKWTDDNGNKRSAVEILAQNIEFADGKKEDSANESQSKSNNQPAQKYEEVENTEDIDEDDDLPF